MAELKIDPRLNLLGEQAQRQDTVVVVVKGVAWNRGMILDGADLDFYFRNAEGFLPYGEAPAETRGMFATLFPDMLTIPRLHDHLVESRTAVYHVDVELSLAQPEQKLEFANSESREFYESGFLSVPSSFQINTGFVRFVLNRFLEETGNSRTLDAGTYQAVLDYVSSKGHNLYREMLSHFFRDNGVYRPSGMYYDKLVKDHFDNGAGREDFIYIKPLCKALKRHEVGR